MADTAMLASRVAEALSGGLTVGLIGDLGAGKTTFVRELASVMGSADDVSSPTFVLAHEYQTDRGLILEHWDLYRLQGAPGELGEPPAENVVRLVEWIDRAPGAPMDLCLTFLLNLHNRTVAISGPIAARLPR